MKSPRLDFAVDRGVRQRLRVYVVSALGLCFGVQLGLIAWRVEATQAKRVATQAQYRQLAENANKTRITSLNPEELKTVAAARAMLKNLAVPWEGLLSSVEAARTKRILVTTIKPNADARSVNISFNCERFSDAAEFITRLEQQAWLSDIKLVSEAAPENGSGPLQVVIVANWGSV